MWAKSSETKLAHHHHKLCVLELPSIGTQAMLIKTTTWQPKRSTTITHNPSHHQLPSSPLEQIMLHQSHVKLISSRCQVASSFTKENNKNKYFVRVCEMCFTAQESLLPWEVKSLRCSTAWSLMKCSWVWGITGSLVSCSLKCVHHWGLTLITHSIKAAEGHKVWHWSRLHHSLPL